MLLPIPSLRLCGDIVAFRIHKIVCRKKFVEKEVLLCNEGEDTTSLVMKPVLDSLFSIGLGKAVICILTFLSGEN